MSEVEEKTLIEKERPDYRNERFQFILSVIDNKKVVKESEIEGEEPEVKWVRSENIICQRYFRINGFNPESLYSTQLRETINDAVRYIVEDLQSKSRTYMWYTYDPAYTDDEYSMEREPEWSVTFKFAFLVDDREVISKIFDGSIYPRFVRDNVDIVNKKTNFERFEGYKKPYEINLLKKLVADKVDLSYVIINLICDVCSSVFSSEYHYTHTMDYGDVMYNLDTDDIWRKTIAKVDKSCRDKTYQYEQSSY